MSYQMTIELPQNICGQILNLMYEHGIEVYGGVNLNWYDLTLLCQTNKCTLFVLWYNEKIVGYSFWVFTRDFMFANKLRADELAVFIKKEHRGRPAIRFLRFCEMKLHDLGYNKIVRYAQVGRPLERVFEKMGYKKAECLMTKEF